MTSRKLLAILVVCVLGVVQVPIAPRVAGYQKQSGGLPSSFTNAGSPAGGVPFLTNVISGAFLMVEAAFGADPNGNPDVWNFYDITADVRQADGQKVTCQVGRADDTSQAQSATCSFQLDNTAAKYSSSNPLSPNYPNVRRNTPIRVRVSADGTTWNTRFFGYSNDFKPSWDESAHLAIVTVTAYGMLHRLDKRTKPLHSPLYRSTLADPTLVDFWSLEDAAGALQAANAVAGHNVMNTTGMTFANDSLIPGAQPLATFGASSSLTGAVNVRTFSPPRWQVDWYTRIPSAPAGTSTVFMRILTNGTVRQWDLIIGNNGSSNITRIKGYDVTGALLADSGEFLAPAPFNTWFHLYITMALAGDGNVYWYFLQAHALGDGNAGQFSGTPFAGVAGDVTNIIVPGGQSALSGTSIGLIAVRNVFFETTDIASIPGGGSAQTALGYPGETATARLTRLFREESVPLSIVGPSSDTAMGAQSVDTFINLVRECENADGGVLFDGLNPGVGYITRASRYSQAPSLTLDAANSEVSFPFGPVDDDQRNRNLVKVDRKNGSSATYEDITGALGTNNIGTYDISLTVNQADDSRLYARAAWEVHKGTFEGLRYPTISLDLLAAPAKIPAWLNVFIGERVDLANLSVIAPQHPPGIVDLIVEGYTETLSPFDWNVTANCSPNRTWTVALVGTGRVDTSNSTVDGGGAVIGAASMLVNVNAGRLWTTTAADFPFDVWINGIQVTVTNITGVSSPQTFTVTGSTVTKTLYQGDVVKLWLPAIVALGG